MAHALRIALAGAGRMAQAIAAKARDDRDFVVAAVWARDPGAVEGFAADTLVTRNLDDAVNAADVVVDFSLRGATDLVASAAAAAATPLVCGVSGLEAAELSSLDDAAASIPVVYDRNMSQGITVLADLVTRAARSLGPGFSVEIRDTHHVHKKDAPSGTALKLGEAIGAARGGAPEPVYESIREGEVPGEHTVTFSSATERLTFEHSVTTRDVFAAGALRAAAWVSHRPPGRYSMHDVLFAP